MNTSIYYELGPPVGTLDAVRAEYLESRLSQVLFDTLKPVFDENPPIKKEHLTVPDCLLPAIRQAIWDFFQKMTIWDDEISLTQRHFHVWTDSHFGSVHKARKTILRMTVCPLSETPSTSYELGDMILGQPMRCLPAR